ncbi:MAG TPA: ABC transporter permease [Paludibacteraceae bacterium]|nr:ABC transporter permease [Paludibacteraceae bacterium]HQF49319.1 ABC transporter permease [Paludibacteraceae bacterium]HQJ89005.1 ABC transporter permease [Paludibacteraceae bacterium]
MSNKSFKNIIKEGIRDSFIIWKEEFRNVIHDAGVIIFFIVAPLGYPLLYCFIYDNEVAKEVCMVVVDDCNTPQSREFSRLCDATRDVRIVGKASNMEEAKHMLREKKAYGIMMIPSDFSKKIVRDEKTYVVLYSDMSSLLYYKAFLVTLTDVSLEMGKDIQIERMAGLSSREQEVIAAPIEYEDVTYFNPQNGFASFLIPAVLILVIQQTMLMGIALLSGAAKDKNTYRDLLPIQRHYRGTFRIVFGKSLCYLMIYSVVAVYLLWCVPIIFSLPQMGDGFAILEFIFPFLLSCIFFSLTIVSFVRDRESSFVIFIFMSLILLFLSGISWPASEVPWHWKSISYLFPSTFGIQGFIKMNTMGATLNQVSFEYTALWIQTFFYFIGAFLVFRWQIIRSEKIYRKNKHV